MSHSPTFYVTGGTLRPDSPSYVERRADRDLYDTLLRGEYSYVLTSRQMGKSSLMVRTAGRLREAGRRVAVIDLTSLGQNLTPEQWYEGMLLILAARLDLEDEVEDHWLSTDQRAPLRRFMAALDEVVLPSLETGLVVFIDEIDAVRSLPFSSDEFFAAVRECYNRRATDPRYHALTFCLLGVATPSDLIRDPRTTPFNIGRAIELTDFTPEEARPLAAGLRGGGSSLILLDRALYWTGGHPYLTQRLCRAITEQAETSSAPEGSLTPPRVDSLAEELFLTSKAQERDDNLVFVRELLLRCGPATDGRVDLAALLDLYRRIRTGQSVRADDTNPVIDHLRLSGIVQLPATGEGKSARQPSLKVRNRIYAHVFNPRWIAEHMPDAEMRRQKAAFRRGLIRASAGAGVVVAVMAGLAAYALYQADRADENLGIATNRAVELQQVSASATRLAGERKDALGRLQRALAGLQTALGESRSARKQALLKAAAAEAAEKRTESARQLEQESARQAKLQERLARAAGARERAAARGALEVLSRGQADRGVRLLEEGDSAGLLDLLQARRTVEQVPAAQAAREQLWSAWFRTVSGDLQAAFSQNGAVLRTTFSPDGRTLASTALDGSLNVWSAGAGKRLLGPLRVEAESTTPKGPGATPAMTCLAYSSDGAVLAGSESGRVFLWDTASGRRLPGVLRHDDPVIAMGFAPDSDLVTVSLVLPRRVGTATGLPLHIGEVQVRTWRWKEARVASGPHSLLYGETRRPARYEPTGYMGGGVALSPDSRYVLLHDQSQIEIWECATGRSFGRPLRVPRGIQSVALGPGARQVAVSQQRGIELWDPRSGSPSGRTFPQQGVASLVFSADGERLGAGTLDGQVQVWSAERGERIGPLRRHQAYVTSMAFSPDSRRLVTGSLDSTLRLWSTDFRGDEPATFPLGVNTGLFFGHRGRVLALSETGGTFLDPETLRPVGPKLELQPFFRGGTGDAVAFSRDDRLVAARTSQGEVRLWETATGRLRAAVPARAQVSRLTFNRDGTRLAIVTFDGTLRLLDTRTGKQVGEPLQALYLGSIYSATYRDRVQPEPFSPDGRHVLASKGEADLRLADARTGQPRPSPLAREQVLAAAFSSNGAVVAFSTKTGVRLVDARSGKVRWQRRPLGLAVRTLFAPGDHVLVCSEARPEDPTQALLRLYDVSSGKELGAFPTMQEGVFPPRFSPDGENVALASPDGTVRIWNLRTRRSHGAPMRQSSFAIPLTFTAGGSMLLTETLNGKLRLWDVATTLPVSPEIQVRTAAINNFPGEGVWPTPDDRWLLVAGQASQVQRWPLHAPRYSLLEMERLTAVSTGARYSRSGLIEPLPTREWDQLRHWAESRPGMLPPVRTNPVAAAQTPGIVGRAQVPARSASTPPQLIDLSDFYNAALSESWHAGVPRNDLGELPQGLQQLGGVQWDIRGVVQLAGGGLVERRSFPREAGSIRVDQAFRKLHVLHATAFRVPNGTRIGKLVLHYADGHRWELPIVYGKHVRDWWSISDDTSEGTEVAWTGANPASRANRSQVRLFKSSFPSPVPEVPLERVDYVSTMTQSCPFLLAITVE